MMTEHGIARYPSMWGERCYPVVSQQKGHRPRLRRRAHETTICQGWFSGHEVPKLHSVQMDGSSVLPMYDDNMGVYSR